MLGAEPVDPVLFRFLFAAFYFGRRTYCFIVFLLVFIGFLLLYCLIFDDLSTSNKCNNFIGVLLGFYWFLLVYWFLGFGHEVIFFE